MIEVKTKSVLTSVVLGMNSVNVWAVGLAKQMGLLGFGCPT